MDIKDAVRAIDNGKRVGRGYSCESYAGFWELKVDKWGIHYKCASDADEGDLLSIEDILAEDWEIIQEVEE